MNRRITPFIILAILCLVRPAFSQPAIEYLRQYDTGRNEGFRDVYPVSDGGFIACGGAFTEDADYSEWHTGDRYVVRTDSSGRELWSLRLDGLVRAHSIIETDAGDFLIGGGVDNPFLAFRISADGDLLWSRNYFAGGCYAVIELKDGDFLLAGKNIPGRFSNGCLVRIDGDGEVVWTNDYDPPFRGYGSLYAVRETEGGVIAVGGGRAWAMKAELGRGELIWSHDYQDGPVHGAGNLDATTLISSHDGNFIMGGYTNGGFIIKFDQDGEQIWSKRASNADAYVLCLSKIEGSGFVGVGPVTIRIDNRTSFSRWAAWRFDSDGNRLWEQIYAFDEDDRYAVAFNRPYSVVTSGSSIVIAGGLRNEGGEGDWDAVLMRLEPDILGPQLFYRLPEDSLISVLQHERVTFVVRARSRYHEEMGYQWFLDDNRRGRDTTETIRFDNHGVFDVVCRVSNIDATINVTWHITVTDLYVSAFTPDTLSLAIRRGESIDFSLDTVRAVEGDPVEYLWLKRNVDLGDEIDTAGSESGATIEFLQSGHYRVDGMAYRGESSDVVSWDVSVRGAIWAFAPEELAFEVLPDSMVSFIVEPTFPDAEGQTIQWLIDGELAAEDTTLFNRSFGEADSCPPHLVQVVVADTVESDTVTWTVTVVEPDFVSDKRDAYPTRAELLTVSPNPFNSTLTIRHQSVKSDQSVVNIFDISGRLVADFSKTTPPYSPPSIEGGVSAGSPSIDGGKSAGSPSTAGGESAADRGGSAVGRKVIWDASAVPAGVYFVRLQSGREVATKKVVLMR